MEFLHPNDPRVLHKLLHPRHGHANYCRTGGPLRGATIGSMDSPSPPSSRALGDDGAVRIALALVQQTRERDSPDVHVLNLRNNGIGDSGAAQIGLALQEEGCTINVLDLRDNRIGDEGASALAYAIENNYSLHTLLLSGNRINKRGCVVMHKSLAANANIRVLDLGMNRIDPEPLQALRDEILKRRTGA